MVHESPRAEVQALNSFSLRVTVPNNHILTQNLYYNYYYPNPKYLIIGYMDTKPYISLYTPFKGT